jgi:hypothetical protein
MVQADLQVLRPDCSLQLPTQHCSLIRLCCRQLAHAASKQAARDAPDNKEITSSTQLFDVKRTIMAIESKLVDVEKKQKHAKSLHSNDLHGVPPELRLSSTAATNAAAKQPLFGRMRYDRNVDTLAGQARTPPIFRPIQMTLVPDSVSSFHDVAVCLHQCAKVCTRLSNQSHLVKNSFCLRTALIQHIFTRVIPLPLPSTHVKRDEQCFWSGKGRKMRYETQSDIMRSLHIVAQHFSCASLSIRLTRSFDAERILTSKSIFCCYFLQINDIFYSRIFHILLLSSFSVAALSTIADAVLRTVACDVPSELSLHYSGKASGPMCTPFGIEMRMFAAESSAFLLTDPSLVLVRTQVLDYFTEQRKSITNTSNHLLFRWEKDMLLGEAECILMRQVSVAIGYPAPGVNGEPMDLAGAYLSGSRRELLREYPELGHFRDIIFMLKTLMTPTSDALPEIRAWDPMEAELKWRYDSVAPIEAKRESQRTLDHPKYKAGTFNVKGFQRDLKCVWNVEFDEESGETKDTSSDSKAWYQRLGSYVKNLFFTSASPRAAPSMADPSFLLGKRITCEDDVLHVQKLPDFDGRVNSRSCELLLQYLTAPYLRLPLVLRFFAAPEMTTALANEQLQDMLDAVMFEPGAWQPNEEVACPEQVRTI